MKKIIVGLVAFLMVFPNFASASSIADLQAQIAILLKQVEQLQTQISQRAGQSCVVFYSDLQIGSFGSPVTSLQQFLEKQGFDINNSEVSSNNFGESTASAVVGFQDKYKSEVLTPAGLYRGTGYVGARTRKKINALSNCSNQNSNTTSVSKTIETKTTKPDIKISNVTCQPTNPKIHETIICSVTVHNYSNVDITKSFDVNFQGITKSVVNGLGAWEKRTVKDSSGFSFESAGSNKLNFLADIYSSIDESDESNNAYSITIDVGTVSQTTNNTSATKDCGYVSNRSLLLDAPTNSEKEIYSCFISTASTCNPVKLGWTGDEPGSIEINGKEGNYCKINLIGKESFACKYSLADLSSYAKPVDTTITTGIKDTPEARAVSLIMSTTFGAAGMLPTNTDTGQKLDMSCAKN